MRLRKILGFTILAVALLAAAAGIAFYLLAPRGIIQPQRRGVGAAAPEDAYVRWFDLSNGVRMPAWLFKPSNRPVKAIIILLHGVTDSKASQVSRARAMAKEGFAAFAVDLRGHGDNKAMFATYGFYERYDLVEAREQIEKEYPGLPIGIWGDSYGGAVGLQAMAIDPRFQFGIIQSTYSNLPDVCFEYFSRMSHLPMRNVSDWVVARAGDLAQFNPWEVQPAAMAALIKAPVLLIHGDADANIPYWHAERISEALPKDNLTLIKVDGGGHLDVWKRMKEGVYAEAFRKFVSSVLEKLDAN